MIIGNGDIGKALVEVDRPELLFFASGVSNSQEYRDQEYKREWRLLCMQPSDKHIVYFSSFAPFYSDTRYTRHKQFIEEQIKTLWKRWTIIRLGNITWGDNPHTIINYFKNCIKEGKKFEVRDEYRYLIDKDDFLQYMRMIPLDRNFEMNIFSKMLKVEDIVKIYGHD